MGKLFVYRNNLKNFHHYWHTKFKKIYKQVPINLKKNLRSLGRFAEEIVLKWRDISDSRSEPLSEVVPGTS